MHIEDNSDNSEILSRLTSDENLLSILKNRNESSESVDEVDEEYDKKLDALINRSSTRSVGRPKGASDRTNSERIAIGTLGKILGTQEAAQIFDTSSASPSLNSRGLVNHGDELDKELLIGVKNNINKIRNTASRKLLETLEIIDEEKLGSIKTAREAVVVASGLSKVLANTEPRDESHNNNTFFIHMPAMAKEEDYEVIDVT